MTRHPFSPRPAARLAATAPPRRPDPACPPLARVIAALFNRPLFNRPLFRQALIGQALIRPTVAGLALASGVTALTLTLTLPAQAQAQAADTSRDYQIPAGPLGAALNQFGREAGILLSFDPTRVEGRSSPGLNGHFNPRDGLQRLLGDSGLEVVVDPDGAYRLRPQTTSRSEAILPEVRVTGTTEGSGSYTTNLTNTATKLDLSLRETPQSVTVITHRRMQDQSLGEVSEVLEQTTGIYFHNTNPVGADNNFIYSRGFVLDGYQVNGTPRSSRFGFKQDIADTAVYDRVEVLRGASGLLNGVGEPSGAVNMVRKLPTRAFQGHVEAGYGSWATKRAEVDVSGPIAGEGRVRGRLVAAHQAADTYSDRAHLKKSVLYGVVEADLSASTILSAGIEYQNHRGRGAGGAGHGSRLFYADGTRTPFSRETNLAADWAYTSRRSLTAFAGLEHFFSNNWRLKVDLEQSRRKYDMLLGGLGTINSDGSGQIRAVRWAGSPEQTSMTVHAIGPWQAFGRTHELVIGGSAYRMKEHGIAYEGFNANVDDFSDFIATGAWPQPAMPPTGASNSNVDQQSGVYLAARLRPTDALSVILGGRLTNWRTRGDRVTVDGTAIRGQTARESAVPTPYAGVVYDLTPNLSVYGSYTDIFKPSTDYDVNGVLLDPAEGVNLEAGFKLAFFEDRLNLSLAFYRTRKDNVPEYVPAADGSANYGPTGAYVYRGIDGTRTTGFDLEISGELSPTWQIGGGYSYTNPRDAEDQVRLTHVPRKMLKLFSAWQPQGRDGALTLGANVRVLNETYTDDYRQGGFTVLDLMGQYRLTPRLTATLNVDNLFDKSYRTDVIYGGRFGIPRSAFLSLRYAL